MKRQFRHPSRRRLRSWLESGDPSIDAHLATCETCATRLEDLSAPAADLGEALRTTLAPPQDLQPRLRAGIAQKLQTREDLRLLVELMGIPMQTIRMLSDPGPTNGSRDTER